MEGPWPEEHPSMIGLKAQFGGHGARDENENDGGLASRMETSVVRLRYPRPRPCCTGREAAPPSYQ